MVDLTLSPPNADEIVRYRYQHGTNLGSTFMHGPWLDDSISERDPDGSKELDALKRSLETKGLNKTRSAWETHWLTALPEDDLMWLKNVARCNSIRLSIGFYTFGPIFCLGTSFEGKPSQVYINCWNTLKHLIEKCYYHGIGVLIDLKTVPGGTECHGHAEADTCSSMHNRVLVRDCLAFLVQEITFHAMPGIIGVQISSDADWRTWGHEWYDEVLEITSCINPSLPIYINDGQHLPAALDYAISKNRLPPSVCRSPIVVDTHRYYVAAKEESIGPQAIIDQIPNELTELAAYHGKVVSQGTAVDVYVGEYSCSMNSHVWNDVNQSERSALTKAFGQEQSRQWISKTCGSAFYTFQSTQTKDNDWSFEQQVNTGAIPAPAWLAIPKTQVHAKIEHAQAQRPQLQNKFLSQHSGSSNPCGRRRFALGWNLGYSDALGFFAAMARDTLPGHRDGGDKIGAMELWVRKRVTDASQLGEDLGVEWEDGFRNGVDDFYNAVGI